MTQKLRVQHEGYMLPCRVCATCGKATTGTAGGRGEMHWDCRRDERGNLLTIPLPKPERQHA